MKTARQSRASYFKYEPLEAFEAVELAPFRADRKVQERFIKSALPIVWKTVKRMRVVDSLKDDAEQEGLLGAAHALTLWDPDKGAYHPYARLWVRQRVWLCVTKNRPRFPALSLDVVDEDGSTIADNLVEPAERVDRTLAALAGAREIVESSESFRTNARVQCVVKAFLNDDLAHVHERFGVSNKRVYQMFDDFRKEVKASNNKTETKCSR